MPTIVNDAKYVGRFAVVRVKEALGISVRGDKTFFIDRFSRLCRAGRVGAGCKVLALGKGDGAGSQALTAISAMNFAAAHGLTYLHRPFTEIEHAEAGIGNWTELWERYFNLAEGERRLETCSDPVVPVETFVNDKRLWQSDVVVSAEHYLHYQRLVPGSWLAILDRLRGKYRHYRTEPGNTLDVCLHVRRGDVSKTSRTTARSFTSDDFFITVAQHITSTLDEARIPYEVHVHSQGSPEEFSKYAALGYQLHLDEPALDTHIQLVNADVLVTSKSSFSYTAALLNRGSVLYQRLKHPPLPAWTVIEPTGAFDERAISVLAARRSQI